MAVATVTLTGDGALGYLAAGARHAMLVPALPRTVHLGRRPPSAPFKVPRLKAYFAAARMTAPPPEALDYYTKAAASLARVYLNDREGDCVIAGKAHALGVWSANESGPEATVLASDAEIHSQYQQICGPGDNGCVITNVLDSMRRTGFLAGGRRYPLEGYVAVDWTDTLEVKVALTLFGTLALGINLPQEWTQAGTWDVTNSRIVGGHDVTAVGYNPRGVLISSWGRIYLITWAAFQSRTWLEETYALLAPLWYAKDGLAPGGIDAATLRRDLALLGGGTVPPLPGPPTPPPLPDPPPPVPPPPAPPPAPTPLFTVRVNRDLRPNQWLAVRVPVAVPRGEYAFTPSTDNVPPVGHHVVGAAETPEPHGPQGVPNWGKIIHWVVQMVKLFGPAAEPLIEQWVESSGLPPEAKAMVEALLRALLGGPPAPLALDADFTNT